MMCFVYYGLSLCVFFFFWQDVVSLFSTYDCLCVISFASLWTKYTLVHYTRMWSISLCNTFFSRNNYIVKFDPFHFCYSSFQWLTSSDFFSPICSDMLCEILCGVLDRIKRYSCQVFPHLKQRQILLNTLNSANLTENNIGKTMLVLQIK